MTRNMPTPAFVLVICVMEANREEALPIKSDTSSVSPLLISLADCADISENSPFETLNARVNNPITNETIPNISTAPAKVNTKSFAVNASIFTSRTLILFFWYVAINVPKDGYVWFVMSRGRSAGVIFSPSQKSKAR